MRTIKILMILAVFGFLVSCCVWRVEGPGFRYHTPVAYMVGPYCVRITNGLVHEIDIESTEGSVKIYPGKTADVPVFFDRDVISGAVKENGKVIGTVSRPFYVSSRGPIPWHITHYTSLRR